MENYTPVIVIERVSDNYPLAIVLYKRRDKLEQFTSVIVPAYNEQDLIGGCLDSLLNQSMDRDQFEIVVVNNNSTDLTEKIALDKGVRVENEDRKGYVFAIHKGIEASRGEIIAFTDADCRVPGDWLEKIQSNFAYSEDIIAVGGKLTFYDIPRILDRLVWIILYPIHALPGNNMAIKREAIRRIGGIDMNVNLSLDFWLTRKLRKVGRLKIDRSLLVMTSGRRFSGSFSSDLKYFINVIFIWLSSRPLFFDFPDVREGSGWRSYAK